MSSYRKRVNALDIVLHSKRVASYHDRNFAVLVQSYTFRTRAHDQILDCLSGTEEPSEHHNWCIGAGMPALSSHDVAEHAQSVRFLLAPILDPLLGY